MPETEKNAQQEKPESTAGNQKALFLSAAVVVLLLALFFFFFLQNKEPDTATGLVTASPSAVSNETSSIESLEEFESDVLNPEDFPVREDFFREVYRPRRESYKLFEKAADFLGKDEEGIKQYFGLLGEQEIYASLPTPADDFSELAYLFATGKYYAIGQLGPEYYMQPEFYPTFKISGVKFWTQPDPRYWVPHGFGSYPSVQSDTLSLSGRKDCSGVVFVHSSWGVQTYQGFTLMPSNETLNNFDITIEPQNFLVGPAWPKFAENWVQRVAVNCHLKDGVPPGSYNIVINVVNPPKELQEQWEFAYKNVYFDAAISPIRPSANFIEFNINVTE